MRIETHVLNRVECSLNPGLIPRFWPVQFSQSNLTGKNLGRLDGCCFEPLVFSAMSLAMTSSSRIASIPELSQRILDMAKTGVYRESVFEALQPIATKKSIRLAIAHAKKFGLHSVADLRDEVLGTYYQLDMQTYNSLRHALNASVIHESVPHESVPHAGESLRKQAIATTQALDRLDRVLIAAKGFALALFLGGLGCWVIGQRDGCAGLLIASASVAGTWALQKRLAEPQSTKKQSTKNQ